MEAAIRELFARYESAFRRALAGEANADEVASLYASDFIAASPAGVMSGKNDRQFRQVMAQGYARYRSIGTREMRIRAIRVTPIDECHSVAHVGWTATYSRGAAPDVSIDFEVHYLVQVLVGEAKVFGWVSKDEQEVLRQHGIV